MIPSEKRGKLWETKKECQCTGNKHYMEKQFVF